MTDNIHGRMLLCLHLTTCFCSINSVQTVTKEHRSFVVDYDNDQFLKDGEPFRYISGSMHYFRVPRAYWRDRLRKLRAAGLNAVSTYVEWSYHESSPGMHNFEDDHDLVHFIKLAQQEDLLVILRPGPYICAERDLGGFPPWLFYENPHTVLRTNDSSYTKYVLAWFNVLLPMIQPLLYGNGGPVIMVQVENEYGSYFKCDRNYTLWLRDLLHSYVAHNAVLFTTDGYSEGYLKCLIPGVFATVDFGPVKNATKAFESLREVQKHGPLVNSEFYPGHLTHWGDSEWGDETIKDIVNTTRQMLLLNASFNFYVFHGGTNFGLSSGANNPPFTPQVTSYDFGAPISENGNLTDKYYAIKAVISEFDRLEEIPVQSSSSAEYGTVKLFPKVNLFDSDTGIPYSTTTYPQTFESQQLYSGLMMYQTTLPSGYSGRGYLEAGGVHDRAYVYVNQELAGVLSRSEKIYKVEIGGKSGQPLGLLVENQGHINYGIMTDLKGLVDNVTLNGDVIKHWKHTGYPLKNISQIISLPGSTSVKLPAYFVGSFELPVNMPYDDTFVDMRGWGKGVLWVNEFCLGRYWPAEGPQMSLYLPGTYLRALNTLTVLELETVEIDYKVRLEARPLYNIVPSVLMIND